MSVADLPHMGKIKLCGERDEGCEIRTMGWVFVPQLQHPAHANPGRQCG